jgi:hypothetical protein
MKVANDALERIYCSSGNRQPNIWLEAKKPSSTDGHLGRAEPVVQPASEIDNDPAAGFPFEEGSENG